MSETNPDKFPRKREFDPEKDFIDDEKTSRKDGAHPVRHPSNGLESKESDGKKLAAKTPHDDPKDDIEKGGRSARACSATDLDVPHEGKEKSRLRLADAYPPGREQATDRDGASLTRDAEEASAAADYPVFDEQSESNHHPGAFRVPGTEPSVDSGFSVTQQEDTELPRPPEPELYLTAELVQPTPDPPPLPLVRARPVVEDKPPSIMKRGAIILVGLLVVIGIILGIVVPLVLKDSSGSSVDPVPAPDPGPTAEPSPVLTPEPTLEPTPEPGWSQVGDALVGGISDVNFGRSIALSGDGGILAVGGSVTGIVLVYQNVDGTWTRLGGDLIGENEDDGFGYSVSLSDDATILAATDIYSGSSSGQLRVFRLVNTEWTPIGSPILGRPGDYFGLSVSLSKDGTTVVGATFLGNQYAAVYRLGSDEQWTQVGSDISWAAQSVFLSHNGTVLAIGNHNADEARVYKLLDNAWAPIGDTINGRSSGDYFGYSVALSSDGTTVAVGTNGGNYVAVYRLETNEEWIQVGSDVNGENPGDQFGWSVSLSDDGTVLAVGARYSDSNGANSGQVRVFKLVNNVWTPLHDPINGRNAGDLFGTSLALSADGKTVAGAATGNNEYALVYRLEEQTST